MTLGRYLTIMVFATILCWAALALVVFFVDPIESGLLGVIIFYFAAFFSIVGLASLLGFVVRNIFQHKQFPFVNVKNSFRQAVWFGVLVVISLFLQSRGLISWWNLLLLIVILAVVEMFWVSLKKQ